ncbi:MAG: GntR family transcriptional regulator [Cellulosilyticaceae bacterium]
MPWEFDADKPIYLQLMDKIKLSIISGEIKPGAKLDSVRDMAEVAGVNPNTMQRALSELERELLIYSQRTSGRYVTQDEELIDRARDEYATAKIEDFTKSLLEIGYTQKELLELIEHYLKELE